MLNKLILITGKNMAKIDYTDFMGLLNTGAASFVKPNNELSAMKNFYEYKLGELKKVPGYEKCDDSQVIDGKDVNALHHYFDSSSGTDYLIAGSDSSTNYVLEYRTNGAWASPTGTPSYTGAAGAEIDMVTYIDRAFIVGHDSGTFLANAVINGTAYKTSDGTNLTDMPKAKDVTRYNDLLYVANVDVSGTKYPNRAYYCDDPVDNAITWDNLDKKFLEFGQDDGDEIIGTVDALNRYIVFKKYSTWTWDETDKIKVLDIGCDSKKSIKVISKLPYWYNKNGIWRWAGGKEQLISKKVQPFIDAITIDPIAVQYNMEYRLFIGTVTVDGTTYVNTWLCFDTLTEKFYIRCTADVAKSACTYIESDTKKRRAYFGNNDGYVMIFATDIDNVYSDNGNEIDAFFITNNLDHGSAATVNNNPHITIFSKNPQGMKMAIQTDNSGVFNKNNISILNKNVESKDLNASGNRFKYKFYEKSANKSCQFEGFIVDIQEKESKY